MLTEAPYDEPIVARVAASDMGKAELRCEVAKVAETLSKECGCRPPANAVCAWHPANRRYP